MTKDPKYPAVVSMTVDEGLSPKEMRALRKCTGSEFDDLDTETQLQATGFIARLRLFPDDDVSVLWDVADDTRVKPAGVEATVANLEADAG